MTTWGIDVSNNNGTNWSPTGLGFVIVKRNEGTWLDPDYDAHVARAKANLKLIGAYLFTRKDVGIVAQAKALVQNAHDATFLAVDNEGPYEMTPFGVKALIAAIKANDTKGRQVLLYMSESAIVPYLNCGQDNNWVANWDRPPHVPYLLWQYMSGSNPASSGHLDRDQYFGTLAQLKTALAPLPPAPPSDVLEPTVTPLPILDHIARKVDVAAPMTFYEMDGTVLSTGHGAVTDVDSPFKAANGTSIFYAIYAGPPPYRLILTKPSAVRDIPAQDCSAEVAAAVADCQSSLAGANDALAKSQAELAATKDELAKTQVEVAQAANEERARIAAAEAARIEAI